MSILLTLGIKYILLGLSLLNRENTSEKSDDDVAENSEGGVAEGTAEDKSKGAEGTLEDKSKGGVVEGTAEDKSKGGVAERTAEDKSKGGVTERTVEGEEADNEVNMADDYSLEDDVLDEFFLAGLVPQESASEDEGPSKLERIHSREFNVSSGLGAVGTALYLLLLLALKSSEMAQSKSKFPQLHQ
jgi:hypothetical protein